AERVRILWLTQGVTGHDRRFVSLLAGAGHDVRYLALDDVGNAPALPPGVRWETWGARPSVDGRTPAGAAAFLPAFRAVLERVRPDVVHAGPVPTGGFLAALADARPRVVMSWGSDVLVEAGQGPAWADATRRALAGADRFVCDCRAVLDRARGYAPVADGDVVLVPWGTEPARFHPAEGPSAVRAECFGAQADDAFVVLCTRSWEPIYGIDTLLEGFGRAHAADPRLRLVLAGGGSLAGEVDRWIREAGVGGAVVRPGAIGHDRLPDWFRAANLYASCAHSDGTSVSLLEAMATALPVLVTDIPSNREWVAPGENGWLAPRGDAAAVADALVQAARMDGDARRRMGARNRAEVEARADWGVNGRALLAAYEALAPAAAGPGATTLQGERGC
ncbi:glycosyltransferase family 4 protein, partial [Longimicrobium sp.]|uniref:glycosyltransferase family 4 protein n=1 Tax=Longimicrobium sp. TaxID=2029185 RepID=UPI002E35C3C3